MALSAATSFGTARRDVADVGQLTRQFAVALFIALESGGGPFGLKGKPVAVVPGHPRDPAAIAYRSGQAQVAAMEKTTRPWPATSRLNRVRNFWATSSL